MRHTTYAFVVAIVFGLASFSAYNVGEDAVGFVLLVFAACGAGFLFVNMVYALAEWWNR